MLMLRREFSDGQESPEIVLLHYTLVDPGSDLTNLMLP